MLFWMSFGALYFSIFCSEKSPLLGGGCRPPLALFLGLGVVLGDEVLVIIVFKQVHVENKYREIKMFKIN